MRNPLRASLDRRVLPLCAVFALQAMAIGGVNLREETANLPGLSAVPERLGAWEKQEDQELEAGVMDLLHPDQYVNRLYRNPDGSPPINLFAGYFRSLKTSYGPHSPKICLPGSGWTEIDSHVSQVRLDDGLGSIPVNDYVLEKGAQRIVVMYWYQNKRHTWAREFEEKLYLLPDLLLHHRSDVAIVRMVTTVESSEVTSALENSRKFVRLVYPALQARFATT